MDMPDRGTLAFLGRREGWPSVSIYLPTHRAGQEKEQDPVRFRNLLGQVTEALKNGGMKSTEIDVLLAETHRVLGDSTFWRDTGTGLAVFISAGETRVFKLDTEVPELAVVNGRYLIRHLLPSIHTNERFWLLALSKNNLKFFSGDHVGLTEVPLRDAPASFKDAMRFEDADHAFRFRNETGSSPQGGKAGSVFYGMGGLPDAEKDQVARYVHMVERGVREAVADSQLPLLLAGVEYVVSAYRAQNTYPNLAEASVFGSPDEVTPTKLHEQALAALRPYFESKQRADLAELELRAGSQIVSSDLREIVPAAHDGRVRVLFLSQVENAWGTYDQANRRVHTRAERGPEDVDLVDLAAAQTILHGGEVHLIEPAEDLSQIAGVEPPAALLRY